MKALVVIIMQMLFMMGIGLILRKQRIIDERIQQGLIAILLKVALPLSLLTSSQTEYSEDMLRALLAVAGASLIYHAFALACSSFLTKNIKADDKEKRIVTVTSVFGNTGFVGFPIMQALFGGAGLLLAGCFNMIFNLFMYTVGERIISSKKTNYKELVTNPITLSTIAALILFVLPWRMPVIVVDSINLLGDMALPLSMIIVGSSIATVDIKKLFVDKLSYMAVFLKMIVYPALTIGLVFIVNKFTDVLPVTMATIAIMSALPVGSMNVIFAEKHNCAPKLAARTFCLSVVLLPFIIPLVIAVTYALFIHG